MSVQVTLRLDGEVLAPWCLDGFPDETVLVVPLGDELYEIGVRVMDRPSHTAPTDPPRAATLDEIAEVAHMLAKAVSGQRALGRGKREEEEQEPEAPATGEGRAAR